MAFSLAERIDPKHGMLIVVDMQNDFCHRDGAACKRGRDMAFVANIKSSVNCVTNCSINQRSGFQI
jgi:nicotinamidase-related amidase